MCVYFTAPVGAHNTAEVTGSQHVILHRVSSCQEVFLGSADWAKARFLGGIRLAEYQPAGDSRAEKQKAPLS